MITQEFDINIIPHGLPPRVEVDQYDTGLRTLIAHIYQDDTPLVMTDEYTYTVIGTKPSGTGFSYPATAENGAIVIDVTGQMTVVSGLVECGIIVWSGTDRVGTHRFNLWVQPSALTAETIIDSDDFGSIISDAVVEWMDAHGIVIDDTLTVSGSAADAKATGDAVDELKSALYDNDIIDVFEDGTYNNSTWRGVTLTWQGRTAHVEGTATGGNFTSPNIFVNANGFPANISAGDVINVNIAKTTDNVFVNIFSYVNGSLANEAAIYRTQKYTIPENATGLLIRLLVYNNSTVNGNLSFTITKSATVKSQETVLPTILPAKDNIVATIEAVLNKYGIAVLGKGTYELNRAINMPDGSMIKGAGEATVIKAATGADAIVAGASCAIENVKIHSDTGYTTADPPETGVGIRVSGSYDDTPLKYNIKISNVTIDGFPRAGIYGTKTGTWVGDSISAINCTIFNCYAGIFLEDYSEFGRYTNIMCRNNYIGLLNKSGNNVFENCSFSNNTVGVYLIGDGGDNSRNNGHGSIIGCTINHSNNNNGFAVISRGISANGFMFIGCQIWYGKIQVEQSSGIAFNDCMFGAYDSDTEIINYTSNDLFLMNCLFKVGATFSGSGGETHTVNCFKFDGTPVSVS